MNYSSIHNHNHGYIKNIVAFGLDINYLSRILRVCNGGVCLENRVDWGRPNSVVSHVGLTLETAKAGER